MNNVMDMLVKSGYEAVSIGNDVLPCTLKKGDELVGFLMEDFSIRLLPEHDDKRDSLNKAVSFALEYQGMDVVQNEFKLSQYQDILLTATYDFEEEKPIYNIYYLDKDNNLILRNSFDNKATATQDFASRSGLVTSDIQTQAQETDRIGKFVDAIKAKGYSLAVAVKDAQRAYEIIDKNNNIVGYIGKNNRITITTDDNRVKRFINDTYIDTNPNRVILPSFFEKLKEHLKEIGLALKVIFSRDGRHYAIHDQHQEIAVVNEKQEVTYTDKATVDQMTKIDAMIEEIKRENLQKQTVVDQQETIDTPENIVEPQQIKTAPSVLTPLPEQSVFTAEDLQNLTGAIMANQALTATLISVILSDKAFLSQLNESLSGKLSMLQDVDTVHSQAITMNPIDVSKASQEFHELYDMLQTVDGFNPDRYNELQAEMIAQFGTADPKEFEVKLQRGDYKEPGTLAEKLEVSHQKADRQNVKNEQSHTLEQSKEKGRA